MRPQFIGRDFRPLAITPDVDWQPLSRVLLNRLFDGHLERHQTAFGHRQFEDIGRLSNHGFPSRTIKSPNTYLCSTVSQVRWTSYGDSSCSFPVGAAIPKNTRTARFSRTQSSSARQPTCTPILVS